MNNFFDRLSLIQMRGIILIAVVLFFASIALVWQQQQYPEPQRLSREEETITRVSNEPISPIPLQLNLDERKVKLGEKLFHDPRLSADNTLSCATCHNLKTGGTDRLVYSVGIGGEIGIVNSPTVFNSGFNFKQFWDGRVDTLEEQIEGPIISGKEMGSDWSDMIRKLKQSPDYVSQFKAIYAGGIQPDGIKDAIAEFVRSLYTPNSRFDQFLRGDESAMTEEEKEGYRRFKAYGCISCHQGVNIGGNMFQKIGVMADYLGDRGNFTVADKGRFNVTGDRSDLQVFKVPSLRNIALTAPYFHDGSTPTLEAAIALMGKYQLGRQLSSEDINLIVEFLKTLTGEYQGKKL